MLTANADDTVPPGCLNSRNFSEEAYKVWIDDAIHNVGSLDPQKSSLIAASVRNEILLQPVGDENHGFVNFLVPFEGDYVIASDAYPRVQVKNLFTGEEVKPIEFGKLRDCGTVSKVLRFRFTKVGNYSLGFISSQSALLNVLIWPMH